MFLFFQIELIVIFGCSHLIISQTINVASEGIVQLIAHER